MFIRNYLNMFGISITRVFITRQINRQFAFSLHDRDEGQIHKWAYSTSTTNLLYKILLGKIDL